MKVLYDDQAFSMQRFGGVSRCFCELIENLPKDISFDISIKSCNNIHLLDKNIAMIERKNAYDVMEWKRNFRFKGSGIIYKVLNFLGLIHGLELENKRYSIDKLREGNYNVFHATFFDDYFLEYIGKKPFVITVHDMIPELFPKYFPKKAGNRRKALLCEKATAIVAVSQKTKDDLVRILNVPEEKVTVVYHGGPKREEIKGQRLIDEQYFLYVGQREGYKNFKQTLVDFTQFSKYHADVYMVCTGPDFTTRELKTMYKLGIKNKIMHLNVNDAEIKNLYANAIAFIYPSVYEGFGMPILEAYAYGCLTMLNDKSCFREIGGDAAIYFDSVEGNSDLPKKMMAVMEMSTDKREQYRKLGYNRLSKFSWKESARKLADVYSQISM